jgi:NADPH:quinone reductase-like Zn-dependent oxidoreductase
VASRSVFEYKRVLSSRGILTVIGGKIPRILQIALIGSIVSKRNGQKIGILSYKPNKYIEELKELVESGKITPVIDKVYPLSQTAAALQRIGDGRVKGKLIIKM